MNLDFNGKNQVFRGDNGSGKSSIVEAIEFFFTGGLKSLQDTQGLSLIRHAPHVNSSPDDVNITLTFDPGEIRLSRSINSEPRWPRQLQNYLDVAIRGTCILRRVQILEFITAKPADRYRAISSIIGIESLDGYELTLKHVSDQFEVTCAKLVSDVKSSQDTLKQTLTITELNDTVILSSMNKKLAELSQPKLVDLDSIDKHSKTLIKTIRLKPESSRVQLLEHLIRISKLPVDEMQSKSSSLIQDVNRAILKLTQEDHRKAIALGGFLTSSKQIMDIWDDPTCPLCEKPIALKDLIETVEKRLETVRALSTEFSEFRSHCSKLLEVTELLTSKTTEISVMCIKVPELNDYYLELNKTIKLLQQFNTHIKSPQNIKDPLSSEELSLTFKSIKETFTNIIKVCESLISQDKLTKEEEDLLKAINILQTVNKAIGDLKNNEPKLNHATRCRAVASTIYTKFVSTKNNIVQSVFNMIQSDVEKYYSMLHPTDGHKNIKIKLLRRASLELKIDSFGRSDEDPRAYSSEGHLDSLGLCIFLAFVRKFNQDCSLVVLDDVVTTVDSNHREKICELLNTEFNDKQLVLTTHEGLWIRQLHAYNIATGTESKYIYRDIRSWDLSTGPHIYPFQSNWEQIEDKIAESDKTVGRDARVHLEWVLKRICKAIQAKMIYRDPGEEYMIGELLPSAESRLDDLLKHCDFKANLLKAFTHLKSTVVYANIISHDNELSDTLTFPEIHKFCECVKALNLSFACPQCRYLLQYFRELHIIRCPNRRCLPLFEIQTK